MAKDLFSEVATNYAQYRPVYPTALFEHIMQFVAQRDCAWDCATGNGQAARALVPYFKNVEASDISAEQLSHAYRHEKITYHQFPAEKTGFKENSFDLVTIATAYHWLNWKAFSDEVRRVCKKNAVIAAWSYNLLFAEDDGLNNIISHIYHDLTNDFWQPERRYVDSNYAQVYFPYDPLPSPGFEMEMNWSREAFTGYLSSWSGIRSFIKFKKQDPLQLVKKDLDKAWGDEETRRFRFPLFLRLGRIG